MAAEKPVRGKVISKAHLGCDLAGVLAHAGTLLAALSAIFRWAASEPPVGRYPV